MFDETMSLIRNDFVRYMFHIQAAESPEVESHQPAEVDYVYQDEPIQGFRGIEQQAAAEGGDLDLEGEADEADGGGVAVEQRTVTDQERIGRNDPCWCGSGKKFKKCHGAPDAA